MSTWNSTFKNPGKPMKRTAMKSRTKPMASGMTGVLSVASFQRVRREKKQPKLGRVVCGKRSIFRSGDYLAAVRTIPCVCCGCAVDVQAAHSNQLRFGKGRGIKASDATAMALCGFRGQGCHAIHDQGGKFTKAEWWALEYRWICRTVVELIRAGKLVGELATLLAADPVAVGEEMAVYFVSLIESGKLKVA